MLVVISDFHLSEGRRPPCGKLAPAEDFFFDEAFSRFLDYLNDKEPGPVHLVINGDLFDFLQVGLSKDDLKNLPFLKQLPKREEEYLHKYGAKTDEASSIFKLEKISKGHSVFFEALAKFIARGGNKLTVIFGNHDIELVFQGVQAKFRDLVASKMKEADGTRMARDKVDFARWIYYDHKFGVYVEHGNQYESLNSFRYFLYPMLPKKSREKPKKPEEITLPFGSLFVRYLLTQVEMIHPFADNIKPNTKYVTWVINNIKSHPQDLIPFAKMLWQFVWSVAKTFRRTGNFSKTDEENFEKETNKRLADIAKDFHVAGGVAPLKEIRQLQKTPFNHGKFRFFGNILFAYLDIIAFLLSALLVAGFAYLFWRFGVRYVWSYVSLGGSLLLALGGQIYFRVCGKMDTENLKKAREIGEILNKSDNEVKYIVFGHTHEPEIAQLDEHTRYFNTGTWGVIFSEEEELIREKKQFAFLQFTRPGDEPQLMRWNDELGSPELLPLFDSC